MNYHANPMIADAVGMGTGQYTLTMRIDIPELCIQAGDLMQVNGMAALDDFQGRIARALGVKSTTIVW